MLIDESLSTIVVLPLYSLSSSRKEYKQLLKFFLVFSLLHFEQVLALPIKAVINGYHCIFPFC